MRITEMSNRIGLAAVLILLLSGCSISVNKENSANSNAHKVIEKACITLHAKYPMLNSKDYFYSARGYSKSLPYFQKAARLDSGYISVSKAVGVLNEIYYEQIRLDVPISKINEYLEIVNAVCGKS